MCDPVCEHRFRSCHTVYFILSMGDIGYWTIPPFVEPLLLFANLAWRALSWCRRTSVRPPADIEKSVAHRLHCAMPLSGHLLSKLLQFSLNFHFLFGAIFSKGVPPCHIPRIWKTARASYPKNAGDYPMGIHYPRHVTVAVLMLPAGKKKTVTGDGCHA